jgi:hypothetical protein
MDIPFVTITCIPDKASLRTETKNIFLNYISNGLVGVAIALSAYTWNVPDSNSGPVIGYPD